MTKGIIREPVKLIRAGVYDRIDSSLWKLVSISNARSNVQYPWIHLHKSNKGEYK